MEAVLDRLQSWRDDQRSVAAVIIVTILALFVGWGIKASVQNQTRLVSQNGITGTVPMGWVMGEPAAANSLQAWDRLDPAKQFAVTLYPTNAQITVDNIVVQRNLARGQDLNSYRVLEKVNGVINGRDVFEVHFAYVKVGGRDDLPQVIQGTDYYVEHSAEQVMVLTAEATSGDLEALLPDFQRFMDSIQTGETQ